MKPLRPIGVALVVLALGACGMRTQLALGPDRPSVGVEIFANDTREPDLERGLHHELGIAIQQFVDAPLVRPSTADLVVRGRILDLTTRPGVRDRDNQLLEQGVTIVLEGELFDRHADEVRAGPLRESVQVGFLLDVLDAREIAIDRALANLAEALVLDLAATSARISRPVGVPLVPNDPDGAHDHAGHLPPEPVDGSGSEEDG